MDSARTPPRWGAAGERWHHRLLGRARRLLVPSPPRGRSGLGELPLALRRSPLAPEYLRVEASDHRRAATLALSAMQDAAALEEWWQADVWGHRALWHFEQADLTLQAVRQARRIGDLRLAAGDPGSARRYYAEAIDEARDIGAEHEQGLAALGLGSSLMQLGDVTGARRLAGASVALLARAGAPAGELEAARTLLGTEVPVGETGDGGRETS